VCGACAFFDGLALVLAVLVIGPQDPVGPAYAAVTLPLLLVGAGARRRINPRLSDDIPRLFGLLAAPVVPLALFFTSTQLGALAVALPLIVAVVVTGRGVAYWSMRIARARGLLVEPTLLVGMGRLGRRLADTLCQHPEYGLGLVGFLGRSGADAARTPATGDRQAGRWPLPSLGAVDELPKIVRERRIQRVIIAFDRTSEKDMIPVLRDCGDLPAEIHVMPRFFELGVAPDGLMTDDIWGIPLVRLRRSALRTLAWRTKRPVDIAVAGFLLLLTLPLLTLAMIAVALTSPGPIIFRQKRIGERGEIFEIAKLRTLYANNGGDTSWTPSGEARTTPVGGFLRRTGIDELPQLINVIRGQMSLVGPRPERPYFAEQFRVAIGGYGDRERVPAGMTGWAQVHGLRGDTSIEERALFDNHYVEHWSPWRDLLIIARTIGVVLRGQGP
jgi:exopolysaccharide biosynthesis polyprenyl glycosylphosphotransferase